MNLFGNAITRIARDVAAILILGGVILNFANVVGRYFFSSPIEWAEEVLLFSMVAVVFLAAARITWTGRQIAMDILVALLPPSLRLVAHGLGLLVEAVVCLSITWIGVPTVVQLWNFDQRSQAADLPLAIPQGFIPIGMCLIAVSALLRLFVQAGSKKSVLGDMVNPMGKLS